MNRKLEAELGVWNSETEDLRCRIRDVQVKSSAEVAVWKFQAEGLENDFLKKANAEISIWKLDAEMSKKNLLARGMRPAICGTGSARAAATLRPIHHFFVPRHSEKFSYRC